MLLAVRRASVSEVAAKLQEAQLIRYSRGVIEVLDRSGLEKTSCTCYGLITHEYERLLRMPRASQAHLSVCQARRRIHLRSRASSSVKTYSWNAAVHCGQASTRRLRA
jgi:hypothetical protein